MDLMPTVATLAGTHAPTDRTIDGYDRRSLLSGEDGLKSPYDEHGFFFYQMEQLQAVRSGPWKLYLPLEHKKRRVGETTGDCDPSLLRLYDVRHDPGETMEISLQHPQVVTRILAMAEQAREDLGDWNRDGSDQRPAGRAAEPTPRVIQG
jgi:arylsulfatase A-like enzyme